MTILPPDPDLDALRLEPGRLRAERGWSYDELASRSGLGKRTVIEIEQGRTVGTLKTWHALAHALDTPLDELFATLCHEHTAFPAPTAAPTAPTADTDPSSAGDDSLDPATPYRMREQVFALLSPRSALPGGGIRVAYRRRGVSAGRFARMCSSPSPSARRWDGSRASASQRRSLRIAPDSASRLLRCGQTTSCRECSNPVECYLGAGDRLVRLHSHELPVVGVPESCRWHVSRGIAHPAGDGSSWCRLTHDLLCPARPAPTAAPQLSGLRRTLALRTRRLLDTGVLAPPATLAGGPPPGEAVCRPARPVVQLLFVRYLAFRPVDEIQCVAQTRRRTRCTAEVLGPGGLHGVWTLVPVTVHHGQLALPSDFMAVYSLSALPYQEQLRWRTQRCRDHATASTAGDLAVAGWEPFDPLRHHEHIHTRLPTHGRRPGGHAPRRVWS